MTVLLTVLLLFQYKLALPGYVFEFPRDHGSHPEYKIEWWYFTGNLQSREGRRFGYELTFFRNGIDRSFNNPSRWTLDHIHIAHFALTDVSNQRFHFAEKVNRAGPGIAGADSRALNVWNENWFARMDGGSIHLQSAIPGIRLELNIRPEKDPVIHGIEGVSQKAEGTGRASHYYSLTRLRSTGILILEDAEFQLTGLSWMDHEFGTNQLTSSQVGWDWFSIQLDDGQELMLYRLRHRDGSTDPHSSGTAVDRQGVRHIRLQDFSAVPGRRWRSPTTGTEYPVEWVLRIPALDAELRIEPLLDGQELVTTRSTGIAYWEGAVRVQGIWRGQPVGGHGYVELTGYAERHRPNV